MGRIIRADRSLEADQQNIDDVNNIFKVWTVVCAPVQSACNGRTNVGRPLQAGGILQAIE